MRTLFLASSHMSQELSFHTWVAMLYSSIRGSWTQTRTHTKISRHRFSACFCSFYLKCRSHGDSDKLPSHWPWWSGTEADRQWTETPWGLWTGTPAAGYDGSWGRGCCYSVVTWRSQLEPGSRDTATLGPDGYQTERKGQTSKYSWKYIFEFYVPTALADFHPFCIKTKSLVSWMLRQV